MSSDSSPSPSPITKYEEQTVMAVPADIIGYHPVTP